MVFGEVVKYEDATGFTPVISLVQAKQQLRIDYDSEDALIESLVAAARARAEHYTKRAYVPKKVVILYRTTGAELALRGPIPADTDTIKVEVLNDNNEYVETSKYSAYPGVPPVLILRESSADSRSSAGLIRVTYTTGTDQVPGDVRAAMLLTLTDLYDNRADRANRFKTLSDTLLDLNRTPTI